MKLTKRGIKRVEYRATQEDCQDPSSGNNKRRRLNTDPGPQTTLEPDSGDQTQVLGSSDPGTGGEGGESQVLVEPGLGTLDQDRGGPDPGIQNQERDSPDHDHLEGPAPELGHDPEQDGQTGDNIKLELSPKVQDQDLGSSDPDPDQQEGNHTLQAQAQDTLDPGDLAQLGEQDPAGETGGPEGSLQETPPKLKHTITLKQKQKPKTRLHKTPTIKPHNRKRKLRSPGSPGSPQQARYKALK